jgi:chemotaxis protein histidine kinase CheA
MAVEKTINLNVNTKGAQKNVKDLENAVEDVNKEVKETGASTEAMGGTLDKVTGGAVSKFTAFKGTLKGVTTGFKTMRTAIISTGLGALVVVIGSLIAAFEGSEEGQNKFAKIMTVIGALTGNLVDLLADLGEGIIDAFTNPVKTIKGFAGTIKTFITDKIKGAIEGFGLLGSAIKKTFTGDFSAALDDAKNGVIKLNESLNPAVMLTKSLSKATIEFVKEQAKELKQAADVADMRAKADKIERKLIVDRSKLESQIANLRLKSRQEEQFSAAERKQALLDAQKLEEKLLDQETQFLELRRDAQILENTFSRSNKKNLTKEAEAIAAVNRQQAARANAARQVQREVNTISKQIQAENKAAAAEQKAIEDKKIAEEQTRLDAIQKIRDDFTDKQRQKEAETELQKLALEEEKKIAELDRLNATETQKMEVEAYYDQLRDEVRQKQNAKQLEETKKLNEELAQAETNLQQAKASAIQGGLQVIGALAGKSKAVAKTLLVVEKGLAIAQVISNAARAIAQAKANLAATPAVIGLVPNPAYIIQAAATAKGIATTKLTAATSIATIAAQAVAGLGGGGGGGASAGGLGGGGAAADTQPQAPSFNIVGATETSQLAEAVGSQTQQPIQAYVVANDVTTAQSLENNIVEGATL